MKYDKHMSGVDISAQVICKYCITLLETQINIGRPLFYHLLDISHINVDQRQETEI